MAFPTSISYRVPPDGCGAPHFGAYSGCDLNFKRAFPPFALVTSPSLAERLAREGSSARQTAKQLACDGVALD
jgi:hypothetical protein